MTDPLGFINQPNTTAPRGIPGLGQGMAPPAGTGQGKDFKSELLEQIAEVNRLQQDAESAKIGVATGEEQARRCVRRGEEHPCLISPRLLSVSAEEGERRTGRPRLSG